MFILVSLRWYAAVCPWLCQKICPSCADCFGHKVRAAQPIVAPAHHDLILESRGPHIDPFRAFGLKWERKWPKNGFWPLPWKMGKNGLESGKNGRHPFLSHFGPLSHSPEHFPPIFQVRPKSIFRSFSSPFRARGPKWICTRPTGLQTWLRLCTLFWIMHQEKQFITANFGPPPRTTHDCRIFIVFLPSFPWRNIGTRSNKPEN